MIAQRTPTITPRGTRPFHVMKRSIALAGICLLTLGLSGCQPQLDPKEYGELVTELPYVPGIEKPYALPEVEESADKAKGSAPPSAK